MFAAGAIAIGATACGSTEAPAASTPVPEIDMSTLDPGGFPTRPREFGTVQTIDQARIVEATRLAEHLPLPAEIDPGFNYSNQSMGRILLGPEQLGRLIAVDNFDKDAAGFISGFLSEGETKPDHAGLHFMNAVLIFPDAARAAGAAAALENSDYLYNNRNQRVAIPGYPEAHAHWEPGVQSIGSWFASGNLVIYTWVYDYVKTWLKKDDLPALLGLVQKSLDVVVPALEKFEPTPADKLMQLQADPDGMMKRVLPRSEGNPLVNPPAVFTANGALHLAELPLDRKQLFTELGVDRYVEGDALLWRARDAGAADRLMDDVSELDKKYRSIDPPKGLPIAKCKEYIGRDRYVPRYYCTVKYDRYVAQTWSLQLTDIHQLISAQYSLLVNTQ